MADLIELLESFNRKERFFLVSQALGNSHPRGGFLLSEDFRQQLGDKVGFPIPQDYFAAIEYHLDWMIAALRAHQRPGSREFEDLEMPYGIECDHPKHKGNRREVRGTNEDADLLVVFSNEDACHLILVEAKGDSAWSDEQMCSKAERLKKVFGDEGTAIAGVFPYYYLSSPEYRKPQRLKTEGWPKWMKQRNGEPYWFRLNFPDDRYSVTRSDESHFKIVSS